MKINFDVQIRMRLLCTIFTRKTSVYNSSFKVMNNNELLLPHVHRYVKPEIV